MDNKSQTNQGVNARLAAAHLLDQVLGHRLTLDDALNRITPKMRLNDDDRRLAHAICGSVFRNLPAIDALLQSLNRGKNPTPQMLHHILRVGVAQLLYLSIAPHAAVHTTVSAAASLNLSRQKNMVNAILRSVQRQKEAGAIPPQSDLAQLPQGMIDRWVKNYGQSGAEALATLMRYEAPIDLTIKNAHASDEWAHKLQGEVVLPGTVRVHQRGSHLTSWPGFEAGAWWVQDTASSLPIRLLSNLSGKSVLDLCAAPGGKTMQAASMGANVTAIDSAASRMTRLHDNIRRTGLEPRVETEVADARNWGTAPGQDDQLKVFDVVVLDAPCSATGTLRRHPELPWIHEKNQLQRMTLIQHDLLRRACVWVKNGGVMLYATCSLEREEGEDQVESFLKEHKDFSLVTDLPAVVHPFLVPGRGNFGFRTNPAVLAASGGMDGFFMAVLKKL